MRSSSMSAAGEELSLAAMEQQVFISHSRADEQVARALKSTLEKTGATVWLASDAITPGDRWADAISDRLQKASVVLLLIGRDPSEWVRDEWSQALRFATAQDKQIIPVLLDGAEPPSFLGEQVAIRVDSEDVIHNRVDWAEPAKSSTWEWRTSRTARSKLADRLDEISSIASSLGPDEK